ncbi:MAG: GNAT family N-acetyltransferase [Planctomycetes bacterium]|nr:GNAT family N-acetyltransferase [Planctomycetota bacterium]
MAVLELRACTSADRGAQARLFNAVFKKGVDERGLAWRYDQSPHGASLSFAQVAPDGQFVAGYACSPRRAVPAGDESRAAPIGETGDVMTHPDWRKRGLFSALDRAALDAARRRGWPVVFGLPNRRSAHIFLELGWERVGTLRPWTFVMRADPAARRERARQGRVRGWLAGLDARAGRRARARLRATAARTGALRVAPLDAFPAEVADLSRAVEPRFALMVRRDADYLDWRFLRAPAGLFRALGLFEGTRLAAYTVIQVPRPGQSGGYLVDVLGRDEAAVDAAVEAGLAALERAGASFVTATAIDGSWWSARLAASGFRAPKPADHLTVIVHVHDPGHPLAAAAREPSRWYLTDGDRDDETMG